MGDKLVLWFLGLFETTQDTLKQSHGAPPVSVALDHTTLKEEDSCGYSSVKTVRSIADYIAFIAGDDAELVGRITRQASAHLVDDCPKGGEYFPPNYCEKLRKIVNAQEPNQYITSIVIYDQEFLKHPIRTVARAAGPFIATNLPVFSPISQYADALRARREYGTSHQPTTTSRAFSWIAIILLPVGIGLRVLKTSLELFGNLE